MNERDRHLVCTAMASLGPRTSGAVLFDADSTQFVRMNLVLLKGLLEDKGLEGIFITVDRPHQYMAHLLRMHQVSMDRLAFIDAIGRLSGDQKEAPARAGYVDAPFHIDSLPDTIAEMHSGEIPGIDVDKVDFVMIDNLAALLPFNSYAAVEAFVNKFISVMTARWNALVPMVVDRERNGLLYDTVLSRADDAISLREPLGLEGTSASGKGRMTISGTRYRGVNP